MVDGGCSVVYERVYERVYGGCTVLQRGCCGGCDRRQLVTDDMVLFGALQSHLLLTMPLPPAEWWATTDTVYPGCAMRLQYTHSSPVPHGFSCEVLPQPVSASAADCHVVTAESIYAASDKNMRQVRYGVWLPDGTIEPAVSAHHISAIVEAAGGSESRFTGADARVVLPTSITFLRWVLPPSL